MLIPCPRCSKNPGSGATRRQGHCRACWAGLGGRETDRAKSQRRRDFRKNALTRYRVDVLNRYEQASQATNRRTE